MLGRSPEVRCKVQRVREFVLTLCALLCASCGGVAQGPNSGFPALADLQPRSPSDSLGRFQAGSFADGHPMQKLEEDGPFLGFAPDEAGTALANSAYALFYLPVDDSAAGELHISFDWQAEPVFGQLYAAIGNQAKQSWEWYNVDSAAFEMALDPDGAYVDANSGVWIALLVFPAAGPCKLSYIEVEAHTGSGWQLTEIDSFLGPQFAVSGQLGEVAVVAGKPAIVYAEDSGAVDGIRLKLALSSTASGLDAADWVIHDLYRHSASPDPELPQSGFSDTTVISSTDGSYFWGRLAEIGGNPGIAFFSNANGSFEPHYAAGDSPAGANWTISPVSDHAYTFVSHTSNSITRPFDSGGTPALAALKDTGDVTSLVFYRADSLAPTMLNDWTEVNLGVANAPETVDLAMLGGLPVLSVNTLYTNPQVFTMYQFTGSDIESAGDWTTTVLNNIGVGFSSEIQVFSLGSGLGIAAGDSYGVSWDGAPFLDSSNRPQRLFSGNSIVNDSASWDETVVLHESNGTINRQTRFIDLGSDQPAFASMISVSHDGSDSGTETVLRWSVLQLLD
jgi:hypothetical protein